MASTVTFYDACFGTVLTWDWDFGLGATPPTAKGVGPHSVTYDTPGYKTVLLEVTRAAGADNEIKVDYIHVSPSPWAADFTWGTAAFQPTGLSAVVVDSSTICLNWIDNAFNESGFKIERSSNGVTFSQISFANVDATSYQNTYLSSGTQYWYRLRAFNTYGDSSYSNTVSATTL